MLIIIYQKFCRVLLPTIGECFSKRKSAVSLNTKKIFQIIFVGIFKNVYLLNRSLLTQKV